VTRLRAVTAATVVVIAASLLSTTAAQAAPGDPDLSFGDGGKTITNLGGADGAEAAAIQEDGKIVVAGGSYDGTDWKFALARYTPDGSIDADFSGGTVTTAFPGSDSAHDVALQADGKIVAVGGSVIARYTAGGALDTSFAGGGSTPFGHAETARAVAIQPDGKIVVVGGSLIARYDPDGTLDTSFGGGDGEVITGSWNADVALAPDGKIVVAGAGGGIAIARYNADGTFDIGYSTLMWGLDAWAEEVAVKPDGRVLVAAWSYANLESYAMILRYNADGTSDPTFSVPIVSGVGATHTMALQPEGKIVAVDPYGTLARYTSDGRWDASFREQMDAFGGDVEIQADGRIVTVGSVGFNGDGTSGDFGVARYHGGSPDTTPPDTTISGGPSGLTNDDSPTFNFDSSEPGSTFECRVDDGTFSACSPPQTTARLSDGPHAFEVRAIDVAGNPDPSPASRDLTVDTRAPETTITSGPMGTTSDKPATFIFGASEPGSTFECRVDGAAFSPCSSPHATPTLTDGPHSFEVRAIDSAGNTDPTPASQSWTIGADYRREVLGTSGLVSYWRLGETSGTAALDAGGANTGGFRNGVLLGQPSALLQDADPSAGFDGSNDYVHVADHASLDTGDRFTLEAWVKRSQTSSSTKAVLSKGSGSWRLSFTNNVLTLGKGGSGTIAKAAVSTIDTTGFHHFVATKSGATVRLYIDGIDRTGAVTNRTIANTSAALNIGRYTSGSDYCPGLIDEVAIYNVALGAAQVQQHFKASGR
jgi:uncharacterized delta-60 repeat protein